MWPKAKDSNLISLNKIRTRPAKKASNKSGFVARKGQKTGRCETELKIEQKKLATGLSRSVALGPDRSRLRQTLFWLPLFLFSVKWLPIVGHGFLDGTKLGSVAG